MRPVLKVGVVGLGVIGGAVTRALAEGLPGLALTGVSVRRAEAGRAFLAEIRSFAPILTLDELIAVSDVVFDGATAASLAEIARAVLGAGRMLVTMNSGALIADAELLQMVERGEGRIVIPSGGVAGFDAIRAATLSGVETLTLVSRKPPESLAGAPHVIENRIDLSDLKEPLRIFVGNAREAALAFPANANVAATLSFAGPGPERTTVEIWADPTVTRIKQQIHMVTAAAELRLDIESNPMPDNPRTGSLTPLSAIAALKGLVTPLRVGS